MSDLTGRAAITPGLPPSGASPLTQTSPDSTPNGTCGGRHLRSRPVDYIAVGRSQSASRCHDKNVLKPRDRGGVKVLLASTKVSMKSNIEGQDEVIKIRHLMMVAGVAMMIGTGISAPAAAATGTEAKADSTAAADSFSFQYNELDGAAGFVIPVINETWGEVAGHAIWQRDPSGGEPGDALTASDELPDGYGIEAHLSTGRVASTRGHDANYQETVPGDLPEDHTYQMWVCVVQGTFEKCSDHVSVLS